MSKANLELGSKVTQILIASEAFKPVSENETKKWDFFLVNKASAFSKL